MIHKRHDLVTSANKNSLVSCVELNYHFIIDVDNFILHYGVTLSNILQSASVLR